MRAPRGAAGCGFSPISFSSSSRALLTDARAFDSTLLARSLLSPSVVSCEIAFSSGTSGLSGADSTRAICTACERSAVGHQLDVGDECLPHLRILGEVEPAHLVCEPLLRHRVAQARVLGRLR